MKEKFNAKRLIKLLFNFLIKIKGKVFNLFKKRKKLLIFLLIILVILIILFNSLKTLLNPKNFFITIPAGHNGLVFKKFSGGLSDKMLGEGTKFYLPLLKEIYIIDLTRKSITIDNITADSNEFQDVILRLNIDFKLQKNNLINMFREYGIMSIAEITNEIINPNINEITKNIIINYPIGEVLLKQSEIKNEITTKTKDLLLKYYIVVYDVDIENILISNSFRKKIAEIELAIQEKDKEEILLKQAKYKTERELIEAENNKKIKILEAESIKEYNRLAKDVTERVIKLKIIENNSKAIDKWDGKLPQSINSENLPFLE